MTNIVTNIQQLEIKKREAKTMLNDRSIDDVALEMVTRYIGKCKTLISGYSESEEGIKFYTTILVATKACRRGLNKILSSADYEVDHSLTGSYILVTNNGSNLCLNNSYTLPVNQGGEAIDVMYDNTKWKKIAMVLCLCTIVSVLINVDLVGYKKDAKNQFTIINAALSKANKYISTNGELKDK